MNFLNERRKWVVGHECSWECTVLDPHLLPSPFCRVGVSVAAAASGHSQAVRGHTGRAQGCRHEVCTGRLRGERGLKEATGVTAQVPGMGQQAGLGPGSGRSGPC